VVAGTGRLMLATGVAALVLFDLELRFLPVVKYLDSRRYRRDDDEMMMK
jgi:hypothetical protein